MDPKSNIIEEFEGAPEVQERRNTFPVKMSREEIRLLKERANRFGMSAGAYLRFLFHREIQSRKPENYGITKE